MTDPDKIAEAVVETRALFAPVRARSRVGGMLGVALASAAMLGLDFAADRPARRPWKLTGRAATRARWRRQGRR